MPALVLLIIFKIITIMKIALVGYGKMGKAIEAIALEQNHEVLLKIDKDNGDLLDKQHLQKVDVAIEFSTPQTAFSNIMKCLDAGIPVVVGTTAWLNHLSEVEEKVKNENGSFLYASNFSIGVNIFFELNKKLASLMGQQEQYNIEMEEIHHTEKKDAPSGTAITLADQILADVPRKSKWINEATSVAEELPIISKRIDPTPGTHVIRYGSAIDEIEIRHTAHSRKGFAQGALTAAEFIHNKKGIFSMRDVLGL